MHVCMYVCVYMNVGIANLFGENLISKKWQKKQK